VSSLQGDGMEVSPTPEESSQAARQGEDSFKIHLRWIGTWGVHYRAHPFLWPSSPRGQWWWRPLLGFTSPWPELRHGGLSTLPVLNSILALLARVENTLLVILGSHCVVLLFACSTACLRDWWATCDTQHKSAAFP